MRRSANTYRAARRNLARYARQLGTLVNATPPTVRVVEGLTRGWLMRRRKTFNAPVYSPRAGPSKHGKCIIATHLTIVKDRVRHALRVKETGISCAPGPHKPAGSTHAVAESHRHYRKWILRHIANKEAKT